MEFQEKNSSTESSIQNIPSDILYEIFLTAHDFIFEDPRSWAEAPWNQIAFFPRTFGLVCSAWYETILASPRLWASILINDYTEARILEVSLHRSSGAALRLYVCTTSFNTLSDLVRNVLRLHLHRCTTIAHHNQITSSHLWLWATYRKSLTSLTYLNLVKESTPRICVGMGVSELIRLPTLRRLDINIKDIRKPEPLPTGLTTIHVHLDGWDIFAILEPLQAARNLETLAIYGKMQWPSPFLNPTSVLKRYLFPYLQSLSFFDVNVYLFFLGLMEAPRLRDVTILDMNPSHLFPERVVDLSPQLKNPTMPRFERLTLSVDRITAENWALHCSATGWGKSALWRWETDFLPFRELNPRLLNRGMKFNTFDFIILV